MSDMITVFGGSGFLGKQVVRALARKGKRVRVAMRRPHLGQDLRVLGDVGQIQIVQANLRYPESVAAALEGADGAINLVGVLLNQGKQSFDALHVEGAETVAEVCAAKGIRRLVHISALGAGPKGARYARTKFAGEEAVRGKLPEAIILRPSVMFGPEDTFFNRFASMAQFIAAMPISIMPLIGGKTKFQPVFVGDVAEAVANALDDPQARGRTFELGGPRVYTMRDLIAYTLKEIDRPMPMWPLPFFIAQPVGLLTQWIFALAPFDAPLTGDQVNMLRRDAIVSSGASTIADLGVTQLESVEAIVPTYLWRFRPYGQFQAKQDVA